MKCAFWWQSNYHYSTLLYEIPRIYNVLFSVCAVALHCIYYCVCYFFWNVIVFYNFANFHWLIAGNQSGVLNANVDKEQVGRRREQSEQRDALISLLLPFYCPNTDWENYTMYFWEWHLTMFLKSKNSPYTSTT